MLGGDMVPDGFLVVAANILYIAIRGEIVVGDVKTKRMQAFSRQTFQYSSFNVLDIEKSILRR